MTRPCEYVRDASLAVHFTNLAAVYRVSQGGRGRGLERKVIEADWVEVFTMDDITISKWQQRASPSQHAEKLQIILV